MRFLLDTMTIIYLVQEPVAVPALAGAALEDSSNELFISLVSAWEMQIKVGVSKLKLGQPVVQTISTEATDRRTTLLPITLAHIDQLSHLPSHHRDPFDRLLIAQALVENLIIVTSDQHIQRYPAGCLWD